MAASVSCSNDGTDKSYPVALVRRRRICDLDIEGYSMAANMTSFWFPKLRFLFDAGIPVIYRHMWSPTHIFITHCHLDHICNLPMLMARYGKSKDVKPVIHVPKEMLEVVKNFINTAFSMSKNRPADIARDYKIIGVTPGDRLQVRKGARKFFVDVFKCYHTTPCLGYGVTEVRRQRMDKYEDLSTAEMRQLAQQRVPLTEEKKIGLFTFMGDSIPRCLDNVNLKEYKFHMVECTFLCEDDSDNAKRTGHTLFQDLKKVLVSNPGVKFVLYHFSCKYKPEEIEDFFSKEKLDNIEVWL